MTAEQPPLSIGVIGLDHAHIFGMAQAVVSAGGEIVAFHPGPAQPASPLAPIFAKAHPRARSVLDAREILEDDAAHRGLLRPFSHRPVRPVPAGVYGIKRVLCVARPSR
jgi:hypothetical protein